VIAGYLIFTVSSTPAPLFAGSHELGSDDCPANVLLVRDDADLANLGLGFEALLYVLLIAIVLAGRRAGPATRRTARRPGA
jgi:hypothetical protein